ncbi:DUF4279 domain-containing protein [Nocardioides sp. WS12]|uniref:DUF4279 domain-containing protein n=1 Tax=Nocardioides sp. WS12 TaxID=2486272 RepID=UPI00191FD5BA|nr:DUF4279 domain-containing protein [Nocardioides sp. WS12]
MSQYVYFALGSDETTAAEISAHLGVEPDEVKVQGSDSTDPLRPANHGWKISCETPGLRLDEQISEVLDRIAPAADRVRALVEGGGVNAHLQIVRYFNDEDGEEESLGEPIMDDDGHEWEKMAGQHQLLGWSMEREQLALLVAMGADIDADEYG